MRPLRLLDLKRDFALVVRLALADFRHEGRLSLCAIIGMAAVLAPLLVLYGLKFGIVSGMTAQLASDPHARELRPLGQGSFDEPWLAQLATHPETGWLEPATRFLAAGISLRNPARSEGEPVNAELWPTHPGDPLAPGLIAAPLPLERIVLSQSAAEVMTANPKTVPPNLLAAEALRLMNTRTITSLFVVGDDGRPVGVLHVHDCLRAGLA